MDGKKNYLQKEAMNFKLRVFRIYAVVLTVFLLYMQFTKDAFLCKIYLSLHSR